MTDATVNQLDTGQVVKVSGLVEHLDHFAHRVLQDALAEAEASYWLRRAEAFAAVGTPACDEVAKACRHKATLALWEAGESPALLDDSTQALDHAFWTYVDNGRQATA